MMQLLARNSYLFLSVITWGSSASLPKAKKHTDYQYLLFLYPTWFMIARYGEQ